MNPVIGLDVSKGESHAQAFSDRGAPYGKIFRFEHKLGGLASFLRYVQDLESFTGERPAVVLEATGHYHSSIIQFLDEHQHLYIVINPLISHQAKKTNLRKVKTDVADAYQLGELFYKEELEPYKKRGQYLMNLRYLTRQHESLTGMYVQAKLQFQAVLDQVFPEYHGVFGDLYSKVSLRFLALFATSQTVLAMSEKDITANIQRLVGHVTTNRWSLEKAQILIAAAERNPFKKTAFPSHLIDGMVLERIIGNNDLFPISYLDLKVGKAVCRIEVRDRIGRVLGHGTGFLVSPCLLLTNNHVLENEDAALFSLAQLFDGWKKYVPSHR